MLEIGLALDPCLDARRGCNGPFRSPALRRTASQVGLVHVCAECAFNRLPWGAGAVDTFASFWHHGYSHVPTLCLLAGKRARSRFSNRGPQPRILSVPLPWTRVTRLITRSDIQNALKIGSERLGHAQSKASRGPTTKLRWTELCGLPDASCSAADTYRRCRTGGCDRARRHHTRERAGTDHLPRRMSPG
jgi:hypothetical protein